MKITGHTTEEIFEGYNIKTTDDVKAALVKEGQYMAAKMMWLRTCPDCPPNGDTLHYFEWPGRVIG